MAAESETRAEREVRLRPVLEQLRASGQSVFLDLCELLLLLAQEIEGAIQWDHPRVLVRVRQRVEAERIAKRRGVELPAAQTTAHVIERGALTRSKPKPKGLTRKEKDVLSMRRRKEG